MSRAYDVVVLAGGAGSRLGGVDKPGLDIGGRSSLDRVLDAVPGAGRVVVVGPERATARPVTWCREDPPGSGPLAALRTALPLVSADVVVLLAADLPLLDAGTVDRLVATAPAGGAALLVDDGGHEQYLLGAYDRAALVAAVAEVDPHRGIKHVVARLTVVPVADQAGAAVDVDTWDDVEAVRRRL
ncbi:MAG TPA: NTP transferase domain-containing protein [Motilibacteraceae bacterium]|nr:NTP transferase domain-containing protein [Motilibacteraceae bacterium]